MVRQHSPADSRGARLLRRPVYQKARELVQRCSIDGFAGDELGLPSTRNQLDECPHMVFVAVAEDHDIDVLKPEA